MISIISLENRSEGGSCTYAKHIMKLLSCSCIPCPHFEETCKESCKDKKDKGYKLLSEVLPMFISRSLKSTPLPGRHKPLKQRGLWQSLSLEANPEI